MDRLNLRTQLQLESRIRWLLVTASFLACLGVVGGSLAWPQTTDSTDLTPNLSNKSDIWTSTSPQTQLVLGVGDLLFLGSLQMVGDREFREASRAYHQKVKKENVAKTNFDAAAEEVKGAERQLSTLQTARTSAEQELASQEGLIKAKQAALSRTRNFLTSSEKVTRSGLIKDRLIELNTQALRNHTGRLNQAEDAYSALPTAEREELQRLRNEYNEIHAMPEITYEDKATLIKTEEEALMKTESARDQTLRTIQSVQDKIAERSAAIENLRPAVVATETNLRAERDSSRVARDEMEAIAKRKGFKTLGYKALRIGGDTIFAVDLGSRIVYYFIGQSDPGWFPFIKILQKL